MKYVINSVQILDDKQTLDVNITFTLSGVNIPDGSLDVTQDIMVFQPKTIADIKTAGKNMYLTLMSQYDQLAINKTVVTAINSIVGQDITS